MKKILSLAIVSALVLGFAACKKSNTSTDGINHLGYTNPVSSVTTPTVPVNPLGDMPSTFTKKAVIEESTAVWCGYCPNGAYYMNKACTDHPDKVYGIAYHNTDVMYDLYDTKTHAAESELGSTFSISGIPAGFVDRNSTTNNYNSWGGNCNTELAKIATCGLGIITSKVDATHYSVEVHTGFNTTVSGDYRLVVYVLENDVHKGSNYDQHNYMNTDNSSPWFGFGDIMPSSKYKHQHVLRQSLESGMWGVTIDPSKLKAKGEFVQKYTLDISSEWNVANVNIIAMIVKKGASVTAHTIENAQECKLGSVKKWD